MRWPPLIATESAVVQFGRRYTFHFLPMGFFGRILVRLMSHARIEAQSSFVYLYLSCRFHSCYGLLVERRRWSTSGGTGRL
jgi:hypothetical protein